MLKYMHIQRVLSLDHHFVYLLCYDIYMHCDPYWSCDIPVWCFFGKNGV